MGSVKYPPRSEAEASVERAEDPLTVGTEYRAGCVRVDSRGRNVWQWHDARIDIDSTTILLKRLDNDALELEPTRSVPIPAPAGLGGGARARPRGARRQAAPKTAHDSSRTATGEWALSESMQIDVSGGFDPYNRGG